MYLVLRRCRLSSCSSCFWWRHIDVRVTESKWLHLVVYHHVWWVLLDPCVQESVPVWLPATWCHLARHDVDVWGYFSCTRGREVLWRLLACHLCRCEVWGEHARLSTSELRISSSVSFGQTDAMGAAWSQSPEWGAVAVFSLARSTSELSDMAIRSTIDFMTGPSHAI